MASQISASCTCLCSSPTNTRSHLFTVSSLPSNTNVSKFHLSPWFSQLGSSHFSPYRGLRHLGISSPPKSLKSERKERCKRMVVHASLFGVGAPEALVIGVVALLVFGPKGLAEIARNLGKTLRTFQPTIRELQEVSREFKSTLEREIGLDDIPTSNSYSSNRINTISAPPSADSSEDPKIVTDPNGAPSPKAYTSEDYLKITEEQLKASATQQSEQKSSPGESQSGTQTQPQKQLQVSATQTSSSEENQYEPLTQSEGRGRETAAATPPTQVSEHQTDL